MSRLFDSRSSYSSTSVELQVTNSDFNISEYKSLSESIAKNVISIKSSWQQLGKAFKIIGTAKDNSKYKEKVHQIQLTTNDRIQKTSKDLQRLTDIVRSNGDKLRQLHVKKITSDFENVVQMYSSNQKQIAAKMKAIILRMSSQSHSHGTNHDYVNVKGLQQDKLSSKNSGLEEILLMEQEKSLQKIEEDVLDVNKIMNDLATMVKQQAEPIVIIQRDIVGVGDELDKGTSELAVAAGSKAKYRCKILTLLVIVGIILILTGIIVFVK